VDELPFCLQRIRDLADGFPFCQRLKKLGRPAVEERTLLIGALVGAFFRVKERQVESLLRLFRAFFHVKHVPDHTTIGRKNRSKRWSQVLRRFHKYLIEQLPERDCDIATDATGYSGRKQHWRDIPYDVRASQDWVKVHATVETETFLILSYTLTPSNVHESQQYETLWNNLPKNIKPKRSLADSAYTSENILQTAHKHGATPYHGIKKNAIYHKHPKTAYQKMVNFATHWPNRYQERYGKRNHIETTFSMIETHFGHKIRSRTKTARKNETQTKIIAHNIRILALQQYINTK
jgi:transposase